MNRSMHASRFTRMALTLTLALLVVEDARADGPALETVSFTFAKIPYAPPVPTIHVKARTLYIDGTDGDDVIVVGFRDDGAAVLPDDVVVDGNIITGGDWVDGLEGPVRWVDVAARAPTGPVSTTADDVVVDGRIITSASYDVVVVRGHAGNDVLLADASRGNVKLHGGAGSDILCYDDVGGLNVRVARIGADHGAGDVILRNGVGPDGAWSKVPEARAAYFVKNDETTTSQAFLKPTALTALNAFAPLGFATGTEIVDGEMNGSTLTVSPTPNAPLPGFYDAFFVAEPDGPGDSVEFVVVENGEGSAIFMRSSRALVVAPRTKGQNLPIVLVDGEPTPLAGWVLEQPLITTYSGSSGGD